MHELDPTSDRYGESCDDQTLPYGTEGYGDEIAGSDITAGEEYPEQPNAPVDDPELAALLAQNLQLLGPVELNRVLEAAAPYHREGWVTQPDGTQEYYAFPQERQLLEVLPRFAQAADAVQAEPGQATDLLRHTLASPRMPQLWSPDAVVANTAKALAAAAEPGQPVAQETIDGLKELATLGAPDHITNVSMAAFEAARQAGFSPRDSITLVGEAVNANNIHTKSTRHFTDALRTFNVVDVPVDSLKTIFGAVHAVPYRDQAVAYDDLRATVVLGSAAHSITPAAMVELIHDSITQGYGLQQALERAADGRGGREGLSGAPGRVEVVDPVEQREVHFNGRSDTLVHAALPYQTVKSLAEGVQDLEVLADARKEYGDVVAEGAWVFDPDSSTWYSLGGETTLSGDRFKNVTYGWDDFSRLSAQPQVFHVHPADTGFSVDRFGLVLPSAADFRLGASVVAKASLPIEPRTLIVHALGTTELVSPTANADQCAEVGALFEAATANLFERMGGDKGIGRMAAAMGDVELAAATIERLNDVLPQGFRVLYYPRGTDPEHIAQRQR